MCAAYELFDNMADEYRKCPSALYLIYKAALNNRDFSQGRQLMFSVYTVPNYDKGTFISILSVRWVQLAEHTSCHVQQKPFDLGKPCWQPDVSST